MMFNLHAPLQFTWKTYLYSYSGYCQVLDRAYLSEFQLSYLRFRDFCWMGSLWGRFWKHLRWRWIGIRWKIFIITGNGSHEGPGIIRESQASWHPLLWEGWQGTCDLRKGATTGQKLPWGLGLDTKEKGKSVQPLQECVTLSDSLTWSPLPSAIRKDEGEPLRPLRVQSWAHTWLHMRSLSEGGARGLAARTGRGCWAAVTERHAHAWQQKCPRSEVYMCVTSEAGDLDPRGRPGSKGQSWAHCRMSFFVFPFKIFYYRSL